MANTASHNNAEKQCLLFTGPNVHGHSPSHLRLIHTTTKLWQGHQQGSDVRENAGMEKTKWRRRTKEKALKNALRRNRKIKKAVEVLVKSQRNKSKAKQQGSNEQMCICIFEIAWNYSKNIFLFSNSLFGLLMYGIGKRKFSIATASGWTKPIFQILAGPRTWPKVLSIPPLFVLEFEEKKNFKNEQKVCQNFRKSIFFEKKEAFYVFDNKCVLKNI